MDVLTFSSGGASPGCQENVARLPVSLVPKVRSMVTAGGSGAACMPATMTAGMETAACDTVCGNSTECRTETGVMFTADAADPSAAASVPAAATGVSSKVTVWASVVVARVLKKLAAA